MSTLIDQFEPDDVFDAPFYPIAEVARRARKTPPRVYDSIAELGIRTIKMGGASRICASDAEALYRHLIAKSKAAA